MRGGAGGGGGTGPAGPAGGAVTTSHVFDSSTVNFDPGSGKVRANGTFTALYISDFDAAGADITAILATYAISTNTQKGYVRLVDNTHDTWVLFSISAVITHTNYAEVTVTPVSVGGVFGPPANADSIILTFTQTGDAGLATLTSTQIPYGNVSNVATSSADLVRLSSGFLGLGTGATTTGITIAAASTGFTLSQATPTSDVATATLAITSQAPFASAVTNKSSGPLAITTPAAVAGGAPGALTLNPGAVASLQLGLATTDFVAAGGPPISGVSTASGVPTTGQFRLNDAGKIMWRQAPAHADAIAIKVTGQTLQYGDDTSVGNASAPNTYYGPQHQFHATAANGMQVILGVGASGEVQINNGTTLSVNNGTTPTFTFKNTVAAGAFNALDLIGTTSAISPKSSGTVNTQALKVPITLVAYARIATSGSTTTLTIPLATSTTECSLSFEAHFKIATAGSLNAVGDSYLAQTTRKLLIKNVAGTLSVDDAGTIVSNGTSGLTTSSAVVTTSGTNIIITLTANETNGTLGNADCTIYATQVIN